MVLARRTRVADLTQNSQDFAAKFKFTVNIAALSSDV